MSHGASRVYLVLLNMRLTILTCSLLFSLGAFGQKYPKHAQIQSICEAYVKELGLVLNDSTHARDSFKLVAGERIYTYYNLYAEYLYMLDATSRLTGCEIPDVKRSADSFFCTCPEADYSYVVKKEDRRWVITGFKDEPLEDSHITRMMELVDSMREVKLLLRDVEQDIYRLANGLQSYVNQRDSSELISLLPNHTYRLFKFHILEEEIKYNRKFKFGRPNIERIQLNGDTVFGRFWLKHIGRERFYKVLSDSNAKLVIEDYTEADALHVERNYLEALETQRIGVDVELFNADLRVFLKTGDASVVSSKYGSDIAKLLIELRRHCGVFDTSRITARGLTYGRFEHFKFNTSLDSAEVSHGLTLSDRIGFVKDSLWKPTKWEPRYPDLQLPYYVDRNFKNLVSIFGIFEESKSYEDTDYTEELIEVIDYDEEPAEVVPQDYDGGTPMTEQKPKPDSSLVNTLDNWRSIEEPFGEKSNELYILINEHVDELRAVRRDLPQGVVYIRFVIDFDGSITSPQIHYSSLPILEQPALDVLNKLPKWPVQKSWGDRPVRRYRILPIVF